MHKFIYVELYQSMQYLCPYTLRYVISILSLASVTRAGISLVGIRDDEKNHIAET